jgi:hypothetical protein
MHQPRDTPVTVVLVGDDGTEVLLGRLDVRMPDLALVDRLLRLRLESGRCGAALALRDVPEPLRELLELVGVADLLGLEPRRQPEVGEQLGVEEVVQPGDPPG